MPSETAGGANLSAYFKLDGSRTITGPSLLALAAGSFASDALTIRGAAGQTGDLLVLQNSTPTDLVRWASDGRQIGVLTVDGSDLEDRYAVSRTLTVTGTITQVTGGESITTALANGQAALVHTGLVAAVTNAGRIDFGQGMTASYISTSGSAQSRGLGLNVVAQHQGAGLMTALSGLLVTTGNNSPVTTHRGVQISSTVTSSTAATFVGLDITLTGTGSSATYGIRSNGDLIFAGAQKIIGGTTTTSDLTLQTTSGVGATGADMHFLVGNNGATEALTIINSGLVGVNTTDPFTTLSVGGSVSVYSGGRFSFRTGGTAGSYHGAIAVASGGSALAFQIGSGLTQRAMIDSSGRFGVGVTPTAFIHVLAGTATASTAPLKFNTGTNLTTPEAGAVEFSGNELYFTPNTARYYVAIDGYVAKTSTYPITLDDHTINCTSGTFTVTLPTAVGIAGRKFTVKDSTGGGVITMATTGGQTIDGAAAGVLTGVQTFQSTGANWITV